MTINGGRPVLRLTVENTGDRPVQVGSHYHFAEANPALRFDRGLARGHRLAVPAGTAMRFEPGSGVMCVLGRTLPPTHTHPAASVVCGAFATPTSRMLHRYRHPVIVDGRSEPGNRNVISSQGLGSRVDVRRPLLPVAGVRSLGKTDLPLNDAPQIRVDPDTFAVFVDGEEITAAPATELPMAQRYFWF